MQDGDISFILDARWIVQQLRRLQKDLADYAPRAISSHLLRPSVVPGSEPVGQSWWSYSQHEPVGPELKSLIPLKGGAEEWAGLDVPSACQTISPCVISIDFRGLFSRVYF